MSRGTAIRLALVVLVLFVGSAFVAQNLDRTAPLSLNLGVVAWQLTNPVRVPVLMGVCFAAGLLVAGVVAVVRDGRQRDEIARLQQERVLTKASAPVEEWSKTP